MHCAWHIDQGQWSNFSIGSIGEFVMDTDDIDIDLTLFASVNESACCNRLYLDPMSHSKIIDKHPSLLILKSNLEIVYVLYSKILTNK